MIFSISKRRILLWLAFGLILTFGIYTLTMSRITDKHERSGAFEFAGNSESIIIHLLHKYENRSKEISYGDLIAQVGSEFVGTPYLGGTLEGGAEKCRINAEYLDCVTFFELSLNLARMINDNTFEARILPEYITGTRYRNGVICDYTSRLHYTSDWIIENSKNGIVEDITMKLGGNKYKVNLNFMSKNSDNYPALKEKPDLIKMVKEQERQLNSQYLYFIPANKIAQVEKSLENGDIIAILTSQKGLDYSHVGLIYLDGKGDRRLMHASSKHKKVIIDTTISQYMLSNPKNPGITVLRPILRSSK